MGKPLPRPTPGKGIQEILDWAKRNNVHLEQNYSQPEPYAAVDSEGKVIWGDTPDLALRRMKRAFTQRAVADRAQVDNNRLWDELGTVTH